MRAVQPPISKKRELDFYDDDEDLEALPSNLSLPLEDLCKWADNELKDGYTIHTTLGAEILGHSRKVITLSRKDIYNMAHKQELSGDVLVCYMCYLYGELQKSEMVDMVAFVDPDFTGALGCGNPTERAKFLSNRYKQGKPGQIFLVPYNNSKNWVLTAVIPSDNLVYLMDPYKRVAYEDEWKTVVNRSLKFYYAPKNKKSSRKDTKWETLHDIPQQKDHNTCGYYIMRFMKEIVQDKDLGFGTKWRTKSTSGQYNTDDIDAVRAEWAKYVKEIPETLMLVV